VYEIEYGTTTIQFNLIYSDRETLEISVYPDQTVWVTAPQGSSMGKIYEKIRNRRRWISKQIKHFNRFDTEDITFEYISGETHRYLGKQYRLKIIGVDEGESESVKLKSG
jgi:predicted metal-dependent hydrolase